jgi:hypothetical protein
LAVAFVAVEALRLKYVFTHAAHSCLHAMRAAFRNEYPCRYKYTASLMDFIRCLLRIRQ